MVHRKRRLLRRLSNVAADFAEGGLLWRAAGLEKTQARSP
jgi:hypothetical protein